MAERRKTDWREGFATGGGECLVWIALWTLGGIGFLLVGALVAGASSVPVVFAPVIAALLALIAWGVVLPLRATP